MFVYGMRLIRIVRSESEDQVPARVDFHDISPRRHGWWIVWRPRVHTSVGTRPLHHLEIMPMHMDRMTARVEVVDYDLDNVMVVDDVWVGCMTVDSRVVGGGASSKYAVESGDFGLDVGAVVD